MNLWNKLEEIKVPLKLRVVVVRLYENVISKLRNTKGWSKEINCNIGVKQGCHILSPTLFGIYIGKLEDCLEEASCVCLTLIAIVIILLLCTDNIIFTVRSTYGLGKKPRIFKHSTIVSV
jgi:hypothetical protein